MRAGRSEEGGRTPCLFGLAPCGVYHAVSITRRPVRSYRTFSPLPCLLARTRRYLLCCTGRLPVLKRESRTLSGTLPCGVRTFLPQPTSLRMKLAAIARPPAGSVYPSCFGATPVCCGSLSVCGGSPPSPRWRRPQDDPLPGTDGSAIAAPRARRPHATGDVPRGQRSPLPAHSCR